jgi:hypothetical protein
VLTEGFFLFFPSLGTCRKVLVDHKTHSQCVEMEGATGEDSKLLRRFIFLLVRRGQGPWFLVEWVMIYD